MLGFIDPHVRRSLAAFAVILSVAGLVLAERPTGFRPVLTHETQLIARSGTEDNSASSATSSPFAGPGANGRFAVSHGRVLASGTRPMHAEIRIRATDGS